MERKSKTMEEKKASASMMIPPKRRRLSTSFSEEADIQLIDNKASTNNVNLPPKKMMQWKPFMACKVIPSKRIKYISDTSDDETEVVQPTIDNKNETLKTISKCPKCPTPFNKKLF